MSLFDFIKKQFIDIIQWTEDSDGVLAYRFPMQDFEIQYGGKLTVRESQVAVFVNEGKIADVFTPGLYTLATHTLPILTYLQNWDKAFESPFKSDVYFFSTRLQLDRKWGTPNPITLRDPEFGMVRLRAFGIYSFRVADARKFHTEISGTRAVYTVDDLDGQLRSTVVAALTDLVAESKIAFLDLAGHQDKLASLMQDKLAPLFDKFGLALDRFVVQNISLPEELQKVLDQRISMNIVGDLGKLTQYNLAQAIPLAAQNEGGLAGTGMGLGAGLAMGQAMASALSPAAAQARTETPAAPAAAAEDPFVILEKLHGLMARGIISEAEFAAKKADILSKLS